MGIDTFGEEVDGGSFSTLYLHTLGRSYMYCVADSPDSNGKVDSIIIHTDTVWGHTINVHCALYGYVDSNSTYMSTKIANTEVKEIAENDTNATHTFNFNDPPSVTAGTKYYLVVAPSGNLSGGNNVCRISDGGTDLFRCYDWSNTGITLTDAAYEGEQAVDGTVYMHASYTEDEAPPPPPASGDYTSFNIPTGLLTRFTWNSGQYDTASGMRATSSEPTDWDWAVVSSSSNYFYPSGNPTRWSWVSGSTGI